MRYPAAMTAERSAGRRPRLVRGALIAVLLLVVAPVALWLALPDPAAWSSATPPTTALIEQRRAEARAAGRRFQPERRWIPAGADLEAAGRRGGGLGGRQVLRPPRLRLGGARVGGPAQPGAPPLRPGRLHHHAAAGQEPLPRHREEPAAQGARGAADGEAGAPARQAAHPRPLPQRGRVGRRRLRRRGRRAALVRDQRRLALHGPGGAAGVDAAGAAPGLPLPGAGLAGREIPRPARSAAGRAGHPARRARRRAHRAGGVPRDGAAGAAGRGAVRAARRGCACRRAPRRGAGERGGRRAATSRRAARRRATHRRAARTVEPPPTPPPGGGAPEASPPRPSPPPAAEPAPTPASP